MTNTTAKFLVLFLFLNPSFSFADARKSTFRASSKLSQYVALGGNYSSDYNSKEYKFSGSYQYIKNRFINEMDFLQHTRYASSTTHDMEKNRELYDLEISSKILIAQSDNYFNYYNRSKYDEFSDYYYDITNAVGWGRMFYEGIVEADLNIGYDDIKNFESQIVINPNLKANFWITDKIRFTSKAFIFKVKDNYSEELKNRISYKLTNDLSLELYHNYEKKRFLKSTASVDNTVTQVSRGFVFRIRYDF